MIRIVLNFQYLFISGISYAVNSLANAVIIYLLWPNQSILYLVQGERPLPTYDLEITGRSFFQSLI